MCIILNLTRLRDWSDREKLMSDLSMGGVKAVRGPYFSPIRNSEMGDRKAHKFSSA